MRKPKVHVLCEYGTDELPIACSHIRLLRPLSYPCNSATFRVSSGRDVPSNGADIVIVERRWRDDLSSNMAEQLVRCVRKSQACLIYTADDNLLDLEHIPIEQKRAMRYLAREADGVIVSTEGLADRFKWLNGTVQVVPNALDERLLHRPLRMNRCKRPSPGRKVIGYMGTATHDADVLMALQPLRAILRKYSDVVELQFVCGVAKAPTVHAFDGLPIRIVPIARGCGHYTKFVSWMIRRTSFDLAIAPLEDTAFTRCKSDIKFLDYSAFGVAGIYSRVPSYQETVQHLETGYLADNTPEAWADALECMLEDDALRERIAANAQQYVLSTRTLRQRAADWRNAITAIWGQSATADQLKRAA